MPLWSRQRPARTSASTASRSTRPAVRASRVEQDVGDPLDPARLVEPGACGASKPTLSRRSSTTSGTMPRTASRSTAFVARRGTGSGPAATARTRRRRGPGTAAGPRGSGPSSCGRRSAAAAAGSCAGSGGSSSRRSGSPAATRRPGRRRRRAARGVGARRRARRRPAVPARDRPGSCSRADGVEHRQRGRAATASPRTARAERRSERSAQPRSRRSRRTARRHPGRRAAR